MEIRPLSPSVSRLAQPVARLQESVLEGLQDTLTTGNSTRLRENLNAVRHTSELPGAGYRGFGFRIARDAQ